MPKLVDIDLYGVKVEHRDFQGKKFGPQYRTFAVTLDDPELVDNLARRGVKFWYTQPRNDDPPRTKMNVRVDNRYGDVRIVLIDPNGNPLKLNPDNPGDAKLMDEAWINGADMHIEVVEYADQRGNIIRTPMLKSLIAHMLSPEEVEAIRANSTNYSDPIREKYAKYFD